MVWIWCSLPIEEVIVEAPDYGQKQLRLFHTCLGWATRDNLLRINVNSNDLAVLKTMEIMIPKTQTGFMRNTPSATYNDEWWINNISIDMMTGNNGVNPIHQYFSSAAVAIPVYT